MNRNDKLAERYPTGSPDSVPAPRSTMRSKATGAAASHHVREVFTRAGTKVASVSVNEQFVEVRAYDFSTLAGAALAQQAIDQEIMSSGVTRLLIDARDMPVSPSEVNEYMWRWAEDHPLLRLVAVVNHSEVMSVAARMRSVPRRQRVAAFREHAAAVAWLLSG